MYFLRKTFELAVCLLGYWLGRGVGGWGGGILLAFVGLCASSFGWEWLTHRFFAAQEQPSAAKHFIFGAISTVLVVGAAYLLWGK